MYLTVSLFRTMFVFLRECRRTLAVLKRFNYLMGHVIYMAPFIFNSFVMRTFSTGML